MSAHGASTGGGSATRLPSFPEIRRSDEAAVVAGICSGAARALSVDPTAVRLVFAILTLSGGSGIALYLGAWLFLSPPDAPERRGAAARAGGIALFALGAFLLLRGLGLAGSLLIPAALIAAGMLLVSRRSGGRRETTRLVLGLALVVAGTTVYVNESGPFGEGGGALAPGAVAVALVAIVGPWLWRLAWERDAERLERTRTQERAEVAARVHDSVMQTLALIQRHADDPRRVATLARQQERELRAWLYGAPTEADATLVRAVDLAAAEVEQLHGVRVDVVSAGDASLDEPLAALVLAAREAMTNAAKFAGVDEIFVYVEAGEEGASVFVRDRGAGFHPEAVPSDRHGLRESIELRMERHGGSAIVNSVPGAGTEVELRMAR